MSAISSQLVRGLILLLILMFSAQGIVAHYQSVNAWVVYGVCGVLCLVVLYNSLHFPPMSDRWAMSRLVGYEGDSPQDLQNGIDRLRATQPADRRAEPDGSGFQTGSLNRCHN